MPLLVIEEQRAAIPLMKRHTKPQDGYTDITTHDNVVLPASETRPFLARIGIPGEVLHTPGHSDDSVSLVLDNGCAFTGDLTLEFMCVEEDAAVVRRSWQLLRDRGVTTIYPGHGAPYYLSPAAPGEPTAG
jgi:glyoxylase-like metal-dependent hydrolase (beta-lactamase superfamily II)